MGKDLSILHNAADVMQALATNKDGNTFRKYLATVTLIKMAEDVTSREEAKSEPQNISFLNKIKYIITQVVDAETNPTLLEKYQGIK